MLLEFETCTSSTIHVRGGEPSGMLDCSLKWPYLGSGPERTSATHTSLFGRLNR